MRSSTGSSSVVRSLRVQASLLLTLPSRLVELRRHLDPRMARSIPPHLTMIYDDEAPEAGLLRDRLREASTLQPRQAQPSPPCGRGCYGRPLRRVDGGSPPRNPPSPQERR